MSDLIPTGYTLFKQDLEHVASQLESDLKQLREAHIFITGGTGFFGIWLLESLLWANQRLSLNLRLTVLSRHPEHFLSKRADHLRGRKELEFIPGKLTNFEYPTVACTHIIHAATETNIEQSGDWAKRHINTAIFGTRRLLEMVAAHKSEAILITTSGAVYSSTDSILNHLCVEGPEGVNDYASERIVYGQSKRMIEVMTSVEAQHYGYRALIARCFAFVGPYLPIDGNYAIGNFIRDGLAKRDIVIEGDGTPLRSYLYAADLVIWLIRILTCGRSGVPYNTGGDQAVSIRELAQIVAKLSETKVLTKRQPLPDAKPSAYLPSLERSCNDLKLQVFVPLEAAIERTFRWYKLQHASVKK
jgi:nucleoside-diphosphate-sugar epimerase